MAEGISEDLYWTSSPPELVAILDEIGETRQAQERQAAHRAGLVASAVYNVHRKKGTRPLKPSDFVAGPKKRMSPEEFRQRMRGWARDVNASQEH